MASYKFNLATDEEHVITLDSHLISASWVSGVAFVGLKAKFEVRTVFVGNGAKIKVKGHTEKGKKLGKVKGKMQANVFTGEFDIPEDIEHGDKIYFEVELPDNGLKGESSRIPVFPRVTVSNMKWSAEEARRGETLKLTADVVGCPSGTEMTVIIYEYDVDGAHDRISELEGIVENGKIELTWLFDYQDSTIKINTEEKTQDFDKNLHYSHPEYFFTLKIGDWEYGKNQESGLFRFKDELNFRPLDEDGEPFPNKKYIILSY